MLACMSEQQNTESTKTSKPAITARLSPDLFQDVAAISWGMSRPGAIVANGNTLGLLAGLAIVGIRAGKLRAKDFEHLFPSDLFAQTLRVVGAAPPPDETPEEKAKREAEEAKQPPAPGPLGGPRHGKVLPVGEGPRGPRKARD